MKLLSIAATLVIALSAGVVIGGQVGILSGKTPENLGVNAGKLHPPSLNPNSVSSQAALYPEHPQREYASISPLTYSGDGTAAMSKLALILKSQKGTKLITSQPDYLYAQSTTAVLKFTDDVEFWLDGQNSVIQVRSASRLGRKDFGVNRARIEAIRAQFSS
ncbi:DUF1499 domain-containing protein [Rhodoferax sp. PAMC 29310]|uniref:DUF1499 domain-containing protein n=1 Tax=Rhodoferax sp. PAMC 29310 TaxID=2822760 RepID=UPI001B31B3FB|nr:DUF1499 domain-containing protein [Rhodoferax sp. PAMC 29310]